VLTDVVAFKELDGSGDLRRWMTTGVAASTRPPPPTSVLALAVFTGAKGETVPSTFSRRAFVMGLGMLGMLSVPLLALAQDKKEEAEERREEKKEDAEEKKDEVKDKAEDAVDDNVVDGPGTDRSQDRRQDRRRD
jgi:threonine dehydrogenase-like Zn-dependent dehydrogenase